MFSVQCLGAKHCPRNPGWEPLVYGIDIFGDLGVGERFFVNFRANLVEFRVQRGYFLLGHISVSQLFPLQLII